MKLVFREIFWLKYHLFDVSDETKCYENPNEGDHYYDNESAADSLLELEQPHLSIII